MKRNAGDKFTAESNDDLVYVRIPQVRIEAGIRGAIGFQYVRFLSRLVL